MDQMLKIQIGKGHIKMILMVIWVVFVIGVTADGMFYVNKGANKSYAEDSIIEKVEIISLVQCIYQCHKHGACKYTAFYEGRCTLLTATNFTASGNVEEIYSPAEFSKTGTFMWQVRNISVC